MRSSDDFNKKLSVAIASGYKIKAKALIRAGADRLLEDVAIAKIDKGMRQVILLQAFLSERSDIIHLLLKTPEQRDEFFDSILYAASEKTNVRLIKALFIWRTKMNVLNSLINKKMNTLLKQCLLEMIFTEQERDILSTKNNSEAMRLAILHNSLPALEYLIKGRRVDVNATVFTTGLPPLDYAVSLQRKRIAANLLLNNAHWVALLPAVKRGDVVKVQQYTKLFRHGDIRGKVDFSEPAIAAGVKNQKHILSLFLDKGVSVNAVGCQKFKISLLMDAAGYGHGEILDDLIKRGADLLQKNTRGSDALYSAACNDQLSSVRLLLTAYEPLGNKGVPSVLQTLTLVATQTPRLKNLSAILVALSAYAVLHVSQAEKYKELMSRYGAEVCEIIFRAGNPNIFEDFLKLCRFPSALEDKSILNTLSQCKDRMFQFACELLDNDSRKLPLLRALCHCDLESVPAQVFAHHRTAPRDKKIFKVARAMLDRIDASAAGNKPITSESTSPSPASGDRIYPTLSETVDDERAMSKAIELNSQSDVERLILHRKVDTNLILSEEMCTILDLAVSKGHKEIALLLIREGADFKDLLYAAKCGDKEKVGQYVSLLVQGELEGKVDFTQAVIEAACHNQFDIMHLFLEKNVRANPEVVAKLALVKINDGKNADGLVRYIAAYGDEEAYKEILLAILAQGAEKIAEYAFRLSDSDPCKRELLTWICDPETVIGRACAVKVKVKRFMRRPEERESDTLRKARDMLAALSVPAPAAQPVTIGAPQQSSLYGVINTGGSDARVTYDGALQSPSPPPPPAVAPSEAGEQPPSYASVVRMVDGAPSVSGLFAPPSASPASQQRGQSIGLYYPEHG